MYMRPRYVLYLAFRGSPLISPGTIASVLWHVRLGRDDVVVAEVSGVGSCCRLLWLLRYAAMQHEDDTAVLQQCRVLPRVVVPHQYKIATRVVAQSKGDAERGAPSGGRRVHPPHRTAYYPPILAPYPPPSALYHPTSAPYHPTLAPYPLTLYSYLSTLSPYLSTLRACYAISSSCAISPCACYAMSGTEPAHATTRSP
eukprot:2358045-Rhodomonas_salina.2